MLLPIAYLIAARLYRGRSEEQPLRLGRPRRHRRHARRELGVRRGRIRPGAETTLNLALALFCAEAAVFYALATAFYRQVWTIHLSAAMACGAVWQVLTYLGRGRRVLHPDVRARRPGIATGLPLRRAGALCRRPAGGCGLPERQHAAVAVVRGGAVAGPEPAGHQTDRLGTSSACSPC